MQVKLLRLLETGTFRPVGSAEVKRSDFRLICATHKNLLTMVDQGEFRNDLFYRINVFPIYIPSLSERREDIPRIARTLLSRLSNSKKYQLTSSATKLLKQHKYRGNIRELRNIMNRALVLTDTNVIDDEVIELALEEDISYKSTVAPSAEQWTDLRTHELNYLQRMLEAHEDDKDKVAAILGISTRSLYRKLQHAD